MVTKVTVESMKSDLYRMYKMLELHDDGDHRNELNTVTHCIKLLEEELRNEDDLK